MYFFKNGILVKLVDVGVNLIRDVYVIRVNEFQVFEHSRRSSGNYDIKIRESSIYISKDVPHIKKLESSDMEEKEIFNSIFSLWKQYLEESLGSYSLVTIEQEDWSLFYQRLEREDISKVLGIEDLEVISSLDVFSPY